MDALVLADRAAVDALRRALARDAHAARGARDGGDAGLADHGAAKTPSTGTAPRPLAGAKRFFFPPRETLLRWQGDAIRARRCRRCAPFALFGLRACDLAAIAYQDRFFAARPVVRPARRARRSSSVVDCLDRLRRRLLPSTSTPDRSRAPASTST